MMLFLVGFSFPLALTSLLISLFNRTLPHWSGPAYYALFLFSSVWIGRIAAEIRNRYLKSLYWANAFLLSVVILGALHINVGLFPKKNEPDSTRIGRNDFSLDLYGWEQMGNKLQEWTRNQGPWENKPVFFTRNWFPGGHLYYYFAWPNQHPFWVYGTGKELHHFIEVNQLNEPIKEGSDLVYLTLSTNFKPLPEEVISWFDSVDEPDVLPITRNRQTVYNIFVYRLRNARRNLIFSDFLTDSN